ncbi:MAG TPA: hypothetical protein VFD94_03640 [Jatrophihabitans sp.]|jgi:hypothetical protein|nr:hypothetical protein [Jatrophihabitans sp.]
MTEPSAAERAASLPGDDLVPVAEVVLDRACTLPRPPEQVWPWLLQLGKARAGWYLPRWLEYLMPPARRALRRIEPRWQALTVGDVIPDWGGRHATFQLALLEPGRTLVYWSSRGRTHLSWAIVLHPLAGGSTRLQFRLRLAPVRHRRVAELAGGLFDQLSIAGLAAGLRERLR